MAKNTELIVGIAATTVFMSIGAALIGFGCLLQWERSQLLATGQRVNGVLVGLEKLERDPEKNRSDKAVVPIVRFTTGAGQEVTVRGSTWQRFQANYQAGDTVAVIYDPAQPQNARMDTFVEIWFAPLMLWLVGGGAVLIPPLTIWRYLRSGRASDGSLPGDRS